MDDANLATVAFFSLIPRGSSAAVGDDACGGSAFIETVFLGLGFAFGAGGLPENKD